MSRPHTVFPRSQHEFHVTTKDPSVLTSARPRHQKGCRDTNSSSLGRDAKTMSRPHPVWPRLRARCPGRGPPLALSCTLLRARPPLPCAPAAFLSRPQHQVVTQCWKLAVAIPVSVLHNFFFFSISSLHCYFLHTVT